MNYKAFTAIIGVFIGCCSNVVFLELLVKTDPGSGNLITFAQFFFIAAEGFILTADFGRKKPVIGLKDYSLLVIMFFVTSVCNNYAFDFNIPMPLHMIFRAGSLIANMIMGIILLKKRYVILKYISVLMITAGIILCTVVSGTDVKDTSNPKLEKSELTSSYSVLFWWSLGIALLTVALLISAVMGIYQEVLYKKFGKHPREALFYTHLMPLPGFVFLYQNIWEHLAIVAKTDPIPVPILASIGLTIGLPSGLLYLAGNVITQYICIRSVYVLTTECASLTVTLVVTLRKFVSLLFSVLYFHNDFTIFHWLGTILVFVGTILFAEVIPNIIEALCRSRSSSSIIEPEKKGKKVD